MCNRNRWYRRLIQTLSAAIFVRVCVLSSFFRWELDQTAGQKTISPNHSKAEKVNISTARQACMIHTNLPNISLFCLKENVGATHELQ